MNKTLLFDEVKILAGGVLNEAEALPWAPHASFRGVYMKNILSGSETGGRLSCHLVRVEPGCEIGLHKHDGRMELHEIVSGSGRCLVGDKKFVYTPGIVSCIPENIFHRVEAGAEGICFLAKFSPALI